MNIRTTAVALAAAFSALSVGARGQEKFSFKSGVELVSVTVTVTDSAGRFVPNLRASDFTLLEDGKEQPVAQFEAERVPVSLGLAVDTSGSMIGDKWDAAEAALGRFLGDLLGPEDEVFLYRFDSRATLVRGWTSDRRGVAQALGTVKPSGGTAMFDAIAQAVPLTDSASRRKKALLVISDGNDTSSRTTIQDLRQLIHQREVIVYAIGIDAGGDPGPQSRSSSSQSSGPRTRPVPSPFPGKAPTTRTPPTVPAPPPPAPSRPSSRSDGRVNADVLRTITDDSGGRTELIYSPRDLDPATAGIASELSRQYFLGYHSAAPKDGRWHSIDVRVKGGPYTVRARKGFVSNPR
jgi:Ca-activated chloride channel family protein